MRWCPHVTVATVVERDDRFLLVEERPEGPLVINQPAGHLEPGETLVEAALRETLEETGWRVEIRGVVGFGLYRSAANGETYYRTTFFARPLSQEPGATLDEEIVRPVWLSRDELLARESELRSPLVLASVQRYIDGHRYPLDILYNC